MRNSEMASKIAEGKAQEGLGFRLTWNIQLGSYMGRVASRELERV